MDDRIKDRKLAYLGLDGDEFPLESFPLWAQTRLLKTPGRPVQLTGTIWAECEEIPFHGFSVWLWNTHGHHVTPSNLR